MDKLEQDFQEIYGSMNGSLRKEFRVPWVTNAWEEETGFRKAYDAFWIAREHLCERFGMDFEDADLELFMNGILALEEDVGRRMFYAAIRYAQNGFER